MQFTPAFWLDIATGLTRILMAIFGKWLTENAHFSQYQAEKFILGILMMIGAACWTVWKYISIHCQLQQKQTIINNVVANSINNAAAAQLTKTNQT